MTNNVIDLLERAKARIADEERWIRCVSAMDADGNAVIPRSPLAVCWCASGAIYRESPRRYRFVVPRTAIKLLSYAAFDLFGVGHIVAVNDSEELGFDAVHVCFDEAIERARRAA